MSKRGHSLLELMVVLAIIASLAAIAWPRVGPMLQKSRCREAALRLKGELAEARDRAIRDGTVWELRFQPSTGRYQIRAQSHEVLNESTEVQSVDSTFGSSEDLRSLPAGIVFARDPGPAPADDGVLSPPAGLDSGAQLDAPGDWVTAVVFHPRGRASASQLLLSEPEHGLQVRLSVRGFTGGVKIGRVEQAAPANGLPMTNPGKEQDRQRTGGVESAQTF